MSFTTSVTNLPPKKPKLDGIPAHWADDVPSKFQNPWDSWRSYPPADRIVPYMAFTVKNPTYPNPQKVPLAPVRAPNWYEYQKEEMKPKIKSTWLGHACFLLELPTTESNRRGARILFDPVFSKRCSSSQVVGPKRYTPAPCKIEDTPDIDAIVISHDHYDHMDADTLKNIYERPHKPLVFAPLGNEHFLKTVAKAPKENVHIMDWWESKHVEVKLPSSTFSFDVTCTPCQHFTGRTLWDDFQTLWSSWAVESAGVKVYFAGDTGYRAVGDGEDEDRVPTCPVFREIGCVFGSFDFAMIPIGAYQPRKVMSPIHCAPQDSVRIYQDINARKALGMHWGTWMLTTEPVDEPPKKLAEACKKAGIPDGDFTVCDIGETRFW
ncbi:hypothetical protein M378DRAFT_167757 [Amanita muscaria Koide BX008]|uniref:Metallo-beta-lactamase domain-containing protein n=1 Tax=Amanita muscaria (strain Koide BX008) TaxID=946122 RepID=A0A0C2T2R7_AMAMK|nr:hypothetical protein M378DRAFT_167757 [Amanita muscaria Koide BX008]